MLRTVLLALVLWLVLITTVVLATMAVAASRLRARNRVVPDAATGAPLWWLASPLPSARLHRRLRDAATPLHVPAPSARPRRRRATAIPAPPTVELRRTLTAEAVRLDAHLVALRRMSPSTRRVALSTLSAQVRELEGLGQRIVRLDAQAATNGTAGPWAPPGAGLAEVAERVGHLEAAHAELAAIEAHEGLGPAPDLEPRALPADTGGHLPGPPSGPAAEPARRSPTREPAAG